MAFAEDTSTDRVVGGGVLEKRSSGAWKQWKPRYFRLAAAGTFGYWETQSAATSHPPTHPSKHRDLIASRCRLERRSAGGAGATTELVLTDAGTGVAVFELRAPAAVAKTWYAALLPFCDAPPHSSESGDEEEGEEEDDDSSDGKEDEEADDEEEEDEEEGLLCAEEEGEEEDDIPGDGEDDEEEEDEEKGLLMRRLDALAARVEAEQETAAERAEAMVGVMEQLEASAEAVHLCVDGELTELAKRCAAGVGRELLRLAETVPIAGTICKVVLDVGDAVRGLRQQRVAAAALLRRALWAGACVAKLRALEDDSGAARLDDALLQPIADVLTQAPAVRRILAEW